jgi:hypothetical protein
MGREDVGGLTKLGSTRYAVRDDAGAPDQIPTEEHVP